MVDNPNMPPPNMGGGGGVLSKKLWGLPTWGWIALAAAAGIGGYVWLQSRKSKTDASSTDTDPNAQDTDSGASVGASSDLDQSLLAQIRDLQGANSTATPTTPTATTLPAVTNLKFSSGPSTTHCIVTWSPVTGAVAYNVTFQLRTGSKMNVPFAPVTDTYYKLNKGDFVNVRVQPKAADGTLGAQAVISQQIK